VNIPLRSYQCDQLCYAKEYNCKRYNQENVICYFHILRVKNGNINLITQQLCHKLFKVFSKIQENQLNTTVFNSLRDSTLVLDYDCYVCIRLKGVRIICSRLFILLSIVSLLIF